MGGVAEESTSCGSPVLSCQKRILTLNNFFLISFYINNDPGVLFRNSCITSIFQDFREIV